MVCGVIALQTAHAEEAKVEAAWTLGGDISFNLNQTSFSNWAAGGENAFGGNILFNYSAKYKQDKHIWDNRIELAYGINNTETTGSRKTSDKIYLSSLYGYELKKNLYFSGLFSFQSQFTEGYTYDDDSNETLVSTFMAPGYLTLGCGLTWTPKEWFTATLTPATWRETFVLDTDLSDSGSYGVDAGAHTLTEIGANLQMVVEKGIMENVKLYTRLTLFSDYLENPQNVDVNWEVQLTMNINKWLSASVTTNMIYDDNINILKDNDSYGPALQFKEALGIGLQFKL